MVIPKDILLLEDNRKVTNLLYEILHTDFNIHKASRIFEARKILKNRHIDLISLDVILPDGNGFSFCEEVKEAYPEIKIIILTNKADVRSRIKSFKTGADDYLQKPFFPEEIRLRITRLLNTDKLEITSKYSKVTLIPDQNIMKYEKATIILPKMQMILMECLLSDNNVKTPERLLRYLNSKCGKQVSRKALVVLISRMRRRFERNIGMEIIKTRYGLGYYLSV